MATVVGFFRKVAPGVALLLLVVVVVSGRRASDSHRLIRDNKDGDEDFNALYFGGDDERKEVIRLNFLGLTKRKTPVYSRLRCFVPGATRSRFNPGELASILAYLRDTSSAYLEDERPPQPPYLDTLSMGKRAPTACINNCLDKAVSFVRCRSICH